MKSRVELNSNGINYLYKGEEPTILEEGILMTKLLTVRTKFDKDGKPIEKKNMFQVSKELMKLWFK